jgi:hypothetical protein
MSANRNSERAVGPKPTRLWVKGKVISVMFDVSVGAVYRGEAGMDQIRSAHIPGTAGKKRTTRRFYLPDAEKLHAQMMRESEPREDIPANILRLMGRGRIRRK